MYKENECVKTTTVNTTETAKAVYGKALLAAEQNGAEQR